MRPPVKPLSSLFRYLPAAMHSEVLSRLFNHFLKGQAIAEQLEELNGKRIAIDITDCQCRLKFVIKRGRFYRYESNGDRGYDVCIHGSLVHFWQLASREEDPDTLFFTRKLAIEGETDTGLLIKNLIDSLEYDWAAHVKAVFGNRMGK